MTKLIATLLATAVVATIAVPTTGNARTRQTGRFGTAAPPPTIAGKNGIYGMKSQIRIPTGQIQLPVGSRKRSAPAASSFTPAWQTLRLGAGGQITDIHIDPSDNTTLIRTDTYGGYLYVPSGSCSGWGTTYSGPCWQQLVTSNSIPYPDFTTMISPLNYAVGNTLDFLNQLTGDPNVYGRFYAASRASGTKYIETADACPWVNFSDINPKDNVSGTITLTATHSGLVPVTDVQFSVDGTNIGSAQTGAGPYSVSWNTGGVANGAHTLKVQAAGNGCTTTSNSFSIPVTTH